MYNLMKYNKFDFVEYWKSYTISFELFDGVSVDDITVEVDDDKLYVTCKKTSEYGEQEVKYVRSMPENVDSENIKAVIESNGTTLKIILPKIHYDGTN